MVRNEGKPVADDVAAEPARPAEPQRRSPPLAIGLGLGVRVSVGVDDHGDAPVAPSSTLTARRTRSSWTGWSWRGWAARLVKSRYVMIALHDYEVADL